MLLAVYNTQGPPSDGMASFPRPLYIFSYFLISLEPLVLQVHLEMTISVNSVLVLAYVLSVLLILVSSVGRTWGIS